MECIKINDIEIPCVITEEMIIFNENRHTVKVTFFELSKKELEFLKYRKIKYLLLKYGKDYYLMKDIKLKRYNDMVIHAFEFAVESFTKANRKVKLSKIIN